MELAALPRQKPLPEGFVERVAAIVGPKAVVTDAAALTNYVIDQRGNLRGTTPLVVRPADTAEVAAIVTLCAAARVPMVPQGGNTGLTGATITNGEVIISLSRLDRVRAVDPANFTITAEAGCILANVQQAAEQHDRLFPLSLGAEGTCQIGGNLATNAGGTAVLRYGNTRDLVLGLEVVLPDGQVWDGLRTLRKDNTGYDLKHLFVGAEGTLGIITAATLKLFPLPGHYETAIAATPSTDAALEFLSLARRLCSDTVSTFEYLSAIAMQSAVDHGPGCRNPLSAVHDCTILIEVATNQKAADSPLERLLAAAYDKGLVVDAAIAASETQRADFWRLREATTPGQAALGASIKNDVAVPVSAVPEFLRRAAVALQDACPGIRPFPFGHLGDGNIHYNLTQPEGADPKAFLARWHELTGVVNAVVTDLGGSISAEHGIGILKRDVLTQVKSPVEMQLMKTVKDAFDPLGLMNPSKVFTPVSDTDP